MGIVDDLPRLATWLQEPTNGSLRLINRRSLKSMNSWLHNLPTLTKGKDPCTLQIHPEDAAARGLGEGDRARLSSSVGSVEAPIELSDQVARGVVSLPHGFGHEGNGVRLELAGQRPGSDVNRLGDDAASDAPSGASVPL